MRTENSAEAAFSSDPFDDLAAIYSASRTSKAIVSVLLLLILLASLGASIFLVNECMKNKEWILAILGVGVLVVFSLGAIYAWRSIVRRHIAIHPNWFEVRGAFHSKRFRNSQIGHVKINHHEIQGITEHTATFVNNRGTRLCKVSFYFDGRWDEIEGWIRATFPNHE